MAEIHTQCLEREEEFTPSYRWQHWIRALSIVVLVATGFYIAVPFITPAPNPEPTGALQSYFRAFHLFFGFLLIAVVIFKSYIFLFVKDSTGERKSLADLFSPSVWAKQIGYYLFITRHPKLRGTYNPVQFAAYIGFYLMIFGIILTGLMLYVQVYHDGLAGALYAPMMKLTAMMGGLAVVREVHHILTWGIILFVTVHIYMATFNAIYGKDGSMDAIFSGLKWHSKH
ncbi:MAG: Ni/Fe-hydrogenase, b-type cytochrome subunit [Epsilonproteobacteria bacterium]|nr:Ni/Fe-hydrogenase, b-type cytochrome subunit [Campylobacterota bacterium]